MEWVVLIVVPLLSVGLGAGITYALNVKSRRRTYIDELFDRAISAVSVADAAGDYTTTISRPPHLSDEDYVDLLKWFVTTGVQNWAIKVTEANEALAAVAPYAPPITARLPYGTDSERYQPATEVIADLREWRSHPVIDVKPG
ncbi:MAG TPA: hypothetical protein VK507_21550 [Iamia sp.]|nr:hypothetical protein [Iamia sp.]